MTKNIVLMFLLIVALAGRAAAATPESGGLAATFFPNPNLTGAGVDVARWTNFDLDLPWGTAPLAGVPDDFSVRFTGYIVAERSEQYAFHVLSDDGVRIWIGDRLVLDAWKGQAPTESVGLADLVAGARTPIQIEYFDDHFGGRLRIQWESAHTPLAPIPLDRLFAAKLDPVIASPAVPRPPVRGFRIDAPLISAVSPLHAEGRAKPGVALTGTAGRAPVAFQQLNQVAFVAKAPLDADLITRIAIEGDGDAAAWYALWAPTPVLGRQAIEVGVGDSLAILAPLANALTLAEIGCGDTAARVPLRRGATPVRFDRPGDFRLTATLVGFVVGTLDVTVVGVDPTRIAAEIGYPKVVDLGVRPRAELVAPTANDPALLALSHLARPSRGALQFIAQGAGYGDAAVVLRSRRTGRVLGVQRIDLFTLRSDLAGGFGAWYDEAGFGHARFGFTMTPVIPYLTVHCEFYVPNATVGGRTAWDVPASEIGADGHWSAEMVMDPGPHMTCHSIVAVQP